MSICVFGSINMDITAYSEHLPGPGETIHGENYLIGLGGKGANQASAAAKLGGTVNMIGRIGQDGFGVEALNQLRKAGVNVACVRKQEGPTGIAIIGVDAAGENCITVIGGANLDMSAADAEAAKLPLNTAKVLLLQNEIPWDASVAAAEKVKSRKGWVIFDPAPAPQAQMPPESFEWIDIITPNESETAILTGIRPDNVISAGQAARALLEQGARYVIIKMGSEGLYLAGPEGETAIPAFPVTAIDTVAAGDCFNAGLAHALADGAEIASACRFAAACGALSTTRKGAAQSAPSLSDVDEFLSQFG